MPDAGSSRPCVRRVRTEEWRAYREVRLRALAESPLAFGSTWAGENGFPESRWQERCRNSAEGEQAATFVLEEGAPPWWGLVGCWVQPAQVHIVSMWVDPARRGTGQGGALLDALLAWIRATVPDRPLELDVNPDQSAAVALYASRGFRFTGATEALPHTPSVSVHRMALPPRPAAPA